MKRDAMRNKTEVLAAKVIRTRFDIGGKTKTITRARESHMTKRAELVAQGWTWRESLWEGQAGLLADLMVKEKRYALEAQDGPDE
jgi:hypothetical protein